MTDPVPGAAGTDAPPTCYRHPQRQTYVTCQRCGRPICPDCQIQAPVGVQCPECVRDGHASTQGASNPLRRVGRALRPTGTPIATYTLIGLNVIIYALQWITAQALTQAWFLDPYSIGSEPWRLITSAFLHSPSTIVIHLLFNMYALFVFGPVLESFLGRVRFVALYLIGALGGSLGVLTAVEVWIFADGDLHNAPAGALGASGAVFALLGAVFALRKPLGVDIRQLLILLAINLALPVFVGGIAWQAHVGGLIVGFAIGVILLRTRRRDQRVAQTLAVGGVAVALLVLFGVYLASAPAVYF